MSVEDWARREAEQYATAGIYDERGQAHADGIVHAFSALLSDEAASAIAENFYNSQTATWGKYATSVYKDNWDKVARAALQAAVDAVTGGDTE